MQASAPRAFWQNLLIPLLAIFTALLFGAVIMWLVGDPAIAAYRGLIEGAFGSPRAWASTIRNTTPLILTGLSVAVAFKAGLFNIGAAGQYIMGTLASVAVGINFEGLPAWIHVPLALLAGIAGGALWGLIPGVLKVYTGAHEVIVTIMLNYVASLFASWTVYAGGTQGQTPGPMWDPTAGARSETPDIFASAELPWLFGPPYRVSIGIIIALAVAALVWWIIYKRTLGFEIRTVGLNSRAARYGGMNVNWIIILSMLIAGGLAGLAGALQLLGFVHYFAPEFGGGVGFDGITVALLGQTNPFGIVLSAFLLGAMNAGASKMQFDSGVSQQIIFVIQALVLALVAAPLIVRQIYRLKPPKRADGATLSSGWGK